MPVISVAFVERRPVPGRHFSMERVFDAVIGCAPSEVQARRVTMPCSGVRPMAMLRNVWAARAVRADVVHVTGDVHYVVPALRRSAIRVLTIHDLASLNRTRGLRRRLIRWLWYKRPLAGADVVTTVSEETRRQLVAEFPGVGHKVRVVENPLTAPFSEVVPAAPRAPRVLSAWVALVVGTGANKNVIRAAVAVERVGASLRIIGKLDEDLRRQLAETGVSYQSVHSLTDAELLAEYQRADVLVFASLHEGFGLPILEAQAVGLPVITSDLPPMNEIAAGGALLIDPLEPAAIADAIELVARDRDLRERLHAAGLANVERHAPGRVAQRYAEAYRQRVRSAGSRAHGPATGVARDD